MPVALFICPMISEPFHHGTRIRPKALGRPGITRSAAFELGDGSALTLVVAQTPVLNDIEADPECVRITNLRDAVAAVPDPDTRVLAYKWGTEMLLQWQRKGG